MEVFVSHITSEALLASILKKWIKTAFVEQVEVFVSSDDSITPGEDWLDRIRDSLKSAKVMLVICSADSVSRPWVNFETGAGFIKEIPIIPVCHSGMTRGTLPVPLSSFQALDAGEDDFASNLMRALATHLGFPHEPRVPYEKMTTEVQVTLSNMCEQSEQADGEEETMHLPFLPRGRSSRSRWPGSNRGRDPLDIPSFLRSRRRGPDR